MRDAEKRLCVQAECRARCVHIDVSPPCLKASHGSDKSEMNFDIALWGYLAWIYKYISILSLWGCTCQGRRINCNRVSLICKLFNIRACDMALHTCSGAPQTSQAFQEGAQWGMCVQSAKLSHKCAPAPFPTPRSCDSWHSHNHWGSSPPFGYFTDTLSIKYNRRSFIRNICTYAFIQEFCCSFPSYIYLLRLIQFFFLSFWHHFLSLYLIILLHSSLSLTQCLAQFLACSRNSINICSTALQWNVKS